jgi:hypothetical protein
MEILNKKLKNSGLGLVVLFLFLLTFKSSVLFAQTELKIKKVEVNKEERSISVEVEGGVGPYSFKLNRISKRPYEVFLEKEFQNNLNYTFKNCQGERYIVLVEDQYGNHVSTKLIKFQD